MIVVAGMAPALKKESTTRRGNTNRGKGEWGHLYTFRVKWIREYSESKTCNRRTFLIKLDQGHSLWESRN